MNRTLNPKTRKAVQKRKREFHCGDCGRHRDFARDRHPYEDNNGEYWVCDQCIQAGRPERHEQSEQQSILQYAGDGQ